MPELALGLHHRWAWSREVPIPGGSLRKAALGFPAKEQVIPESGWNRGGMSLHGRSQASHLGIVRVTPGGSGAEGSDSKRFKNISLARQDTSRPHLLSTKVGVPA